MCDVLCIEVDGTNMDQRPCRWPCYVLRVRQETWQCARPKVFLPVPTTYEKRRMLYGNYIKNTDLNIFRTRILEYLREGFRWPARPFKHREPIYLTIHLKYTDGTGVSYSLWCLHIFKCRYRKHMFWRCIICNY